MYIRDDIFTIITIISYSEISINILLLYYCTFVFNVTKNNKVYIYIYLK